MAVSLPGYNDIFPMQAILQRLDPARFSCALYLISLSVLLLTPTADLGNKLQSIGADKFVHVALFAGLAALLKWNLPESRYPKSAPVLGAVFFVIGFEVAQYFTGYRSARAGDLLAGLMGVWFGITGTNYVLAAVSERLMGIAVAMLGLMIGVLFDVANFREADHQVLTDALRIFGMATGILLIIVGVAVYFKPARSRDRMS